MRKQDQVVSRKSSPTLNYHPELLFLLPLPSKRERKAIEASLKAEGWRAYERILTWRGFLVDGHLRYWLCKKLGLDFLTYEMTFANVEEIKAWVIKNQLGRRNLSNLHYQQLSLLGKSKEKIDRVG